MNLKVELYTLVCQMKVSKQNNKIVGIFNFCMVKHDCFWQFYAHIFVLKNSCEAYRTPPVLQMKF